MNNQDTRDEMNRADRAKSGSTGTSTLARLEDLSDFEIADGQPDIRGWKVKTVDGADIGKVESLIADPQALAVRYIEVQVRHELLGTSDDENVLVPIGAAQLNDDDDTVVLRTLPSAGLRDVPRYGRAPLGAEQDRALNAHYGVGHGPSGDDQARFLGKRGKNSGNAKYLTLSEERLAIGKQSVKQGEVEIHKEV